MANRFSDDRDDDLMFGELPDDDDLNGLREEDADANNDETFGGPLPSGTYNELEEYAVQTADLRLDDIWDTPGCSSAAPPASALPMPSFDFSNFGSGTFDFLGTDSKLDSIWGQSKVDSLWPDIPTLSSIYGKAEAVIKAPSPPQVESKISPIAPPSLPLQPPVQEPKSAIPTMPKAPTLEEIEKMHAMAKQQQETVKPLIPAIPPTAMSAEDLERKILQESQIRNQQMPNGAHMHPQIPPLLGNMAPNPVAMRICPAIPPVFVPCFVPWLDVLTGRTQNLPPGCPPPPHFLINLLQQFRNPVTVMNIIQAAVTPIGPPPPFIPNIPQPNTAPPTSSSQHGWHQHPRKPPGMPSARTIEDLAFDQFAGYMSIKERQWLVKIQILQCQGTNNPYEDDYYYLCWRQKKIAEGMQPKKDSGRSETKDIINDSKKNRKNRERNGSTSEGKEKEDRVTTLATRFAGSLGIPTKASQHNPRHSIRVQHPDALDEDQEKRIAGHQKKLRTLLMKIESATTLLIECSDRRVTLANAASQANKENLVFEINERVNCVLKELFCEEFFRVMQVSKGRGLISRIIRVAMPESISRLLVILIRQAKHATTSAPLQKCILDMEEDIFPAIYTTLMAFQREALVSIVLYLKVDDLISALDNKITFVRDLFLLFLLVCSEKKAAPQCALFQWIRSVGSFDLSTGWSNSEAGLWNMLSLNREDIQLFAQWLQLLVNESSHGSVASKIAQRLVAY